MAADTFNISTKAQAGSALTSLAALPHIVLQTAGMYRCQGKARPTDTIATWTVVKELVSSCCVHALCACLQHCTADSIYISCPRHELRWTLPD